jgi:hypothetical protein
MVLVVPSKKEAAGYLSVLGFNCACKAVTIAASPTGVFPAESVDLNETEKPVSVISGAPTIS